MCPTGSQAAATAATASAATRSATGRQQQQQQQAAAASATEWSSARRHEEGDEKEALAAEAALDFSRSLYALQPLDRFRDDDAVEKEDEDMAAAESGALLGEQSWEASDGVVSKTGGRPDPGRPAEGKGSNNGRSTKLNPGSRREEWTPSAGGRLGPMEAHLESMLLATPFGDAALEAMTRTLAQVEKEHGGVGGVRGLRGLAAMGAMGADRVGVRRRYDGGGNKEEYYVERAAIQTALWGVALGRRTELPDAVRVSEAKSRGVRQGSEL